MKTYTDTRNPKQGGRSRRTPVANCLLAVLTAVALLPLTPVSQAARPGGVPVLLPPFIPVPAPQPFLQTVSPFDVTGFMESATVDTPADIFSAGWMEVNGISIRVPRNTIFQMPAAAMTWQEVFANAPAPYKALNQSGLALSDTPKPFTTYEVHVQGNRVATSASDQYVAGLVFISQQAANAGQGYINAIDYSKAVPEIWVSQKLGGPAGARIRLNTPHGRYGLPDPLADVRFTSDEDNPTITARTGYPMCLSRVNPSTGNDSLCPQWNRPKDPFTGAYSTNFTMLPATGGVPDGNGITHQIGYPSPAVTPDPFEQAPMEVGDYITYAGSLVNDAPCVAGQPISSCQYISAHTINDDVGIFTAPSTWPVYASMGEFRIGVGGTPNPIFPQEALEKVFGDFFTTDNTQLVDIYAVDVNPCTGARTHRFYGTSDPFGPPLGGLKGRARFRTTIGNFLPPTREMAVASRSLTGGSPLDGVLPTAKLIANGLMAGTFQAPQFEFIFPENLVMGSPQIPLTFQEFPFLVNGFGPYIPFNAPAGAPSAGVIGQLNPWPSLTAPPVNCTTGLTLLQPPTANAGSPQTVPSGATVNLDASLSSDPNVPALPLIFTWQQSAGPAVTLLNADAAKPQFIAPMLAPGAAPAVLTFQVAVCNGYTCGGLASVNVTVSATAGAPNVTLSVAPGQNVVPGTVVTLTGTATGGTGVLTHSFVQTVGPLQALTTAANRATFTATLPPSAALPVTLTFTDKVTDSAGHSVTATINVFVGADTITVTNVVYAISKSRLQVAANTNALPKGSAVLTVTPLGANGLAIAPDVVCTYDPTLDTYNVLSDIVNPIPSAVRIRSSYGGAIVSPVTRIR
jgi:hypothetical protein